MFVNTGSDVSSVCKFQLCDGAGFNVETLAPLRTLPLLANWLKLDQVACAANSPNKIAICPVLHRQVSK